MTIQLPYVVGDPNDPIQANFDALAMAWISLRIKRGVYSYTWPGATAQVTQTIPHGVGVAPTGVSVSQGLGGALDNLRIQAVDATNITVIVNAVGGAPGVGQADQIYWIAIA